MNGATLSRAARSMVGLLAVVVVGWVCAGSALAAPAESETVDRSGTLATSGQSMWQEGSGGGPEEKDITLFDQSWNASAKGGSIKKVEKTFEICNLWKTTEEALEKFFTKGEVTTECSEYVKITINIGDFGGEGSASTSGEVGMSLKLHGFASGSVGVTYPVTAHYTIPKAYSFAAGEKVNIETGETVNPTAAISTSFPKLGSAELDGVFGFHAAASFNLCVFECTGEKSIFDFGLPEGYDGSNPYSGKIVEIAEPGTLCFDAIVNFVAGFGHAPNQYNRCHNSETGVNSGYIALPNVKTTSKLGGDGSLTAEGEDPYVVVPVSAVTWAARLIPGEKPPPLNFGPTKIPGTEITLGWETVQLVFTDVEKMRQVFSFKPQVDTTLQWGEDMGYVVSGGKGETVAEGTGEGATFPLGDKLTLSTPSSLRGKLTVKPKLSMGKAELSNDTRNLSIGEGKFSALSLTLDTPEAKFQLPDGGPDITAWPGSKINLGPAYEKEFPLATTSNDVVNGSWTLGGFNEPALADLILTPDPPPVPTAQTVHPVEGLPFEGTVAMFTDPEPSSSASDYGVTIKWGDGEEEVGSLTEVETNSEGTVFVVKAKHVYKEEGEYALDVTIKDLDTPALVVTDHSKALVSDAPLHAKPYANTKMVGEAPALLWPQPPSSGTLASFTDEDPGGTISDYSASIEWGDGHTSAGAIAETEPGSHVWTVSGEHEYNAEDLGPHTVTVTVADEGGSKVTTTLTVIAYGYTVGGDFAIAPASPGQPVSFWGARWSTQNALVAPASFKGFAESAPTPPSCGGDWSSLPGDSSSPPSGVPGYMAVIETGEVVKQGRDISGQARGVAVIKTEPGYQPNPGHAGSGTLIAQICP